MDRAGIHRSSIPDNNTDDTSIADAMVNVEILFQLCHLTNFIFSQEKKPQLEDLSKEELISKCKHLLVIAKKAKASKDGRCWLYFNPIYSYQLNSL